jgi:hypothetical protein
MHLRLWCAVQLKLSRAAAGSEANLSAGVARVENLVDTVSKTGFKGTPAFMSPEQLQVPAGLPRCHMSCGEVSDAGPPRDAKVRRLCICRHHVGDGFADASVARSRSYGSMRLSARPTLPSDGCGGCARCSLQSRWTMRSKPLHPHAPGACMPLQGHTRVLCCLTHTHSHSHTHTHAHTHTQRQHLHAYTLRLHVAVAGCDEGRRAEREASHSAGRTGASTHGCQSPGFPLFQFVQG